MSGTITLVDLGRRRYGEVLELQRDLCRQRMRGELTEDLLLLVEHEPVVTLGRGTRPESLPLPRPLLEARGLEVFEVERGGDVTLHAPGQLVGYPIFDLTGWQRDLHWYLRQLEETLIVALASLGIAAERNPGRTGVWTQGRKIASLGIHVKQWITFHGFALNVVNDLRLFDLIVPCGIPGVTMTSVTREHAALSEPWTTARAAVLSAVAQVFHRRIIFADMAESLDRAKLDALADAKVGDILRAADSWARDVPAALTPAIRAVCVRLAEMVADQRHYLAPLPEPQETERATVLTLTAERLRATPVTSDIAPLLQQLADLELRVTASWSLDAGAQSQWIATAIRFLEAKAGDLPAAERPDPYWADDVVAGIIASVRALIGVDELQARTEARYSGGQKRPFETGDRE